MRSRDIALSVLYGAALVVLVGVVVLAEAVGRFVLDLAAHLTAEDGG